MPQFRWQAALIILVSFFEILKCGKGGGSVGGRLPPLAALIENERSDRLGGQSAKLVRPVEVDFKSP